MPAPTRKVYHRLSDVDEIFKSAFCVECDAVVDIDSKGPGRWTCAAKRIDAKNSRRKSLYGLTDLELEIINKATICDLCRYPFKSSKDKHTDHDHVSKKFRGVLCQKCNNMLGLAGDSIELLAKAIQYLGK